MPTYQYACTECGYDFETVQAFTDAALTECPNCNGRLRKVFNAVGIVFKGSGFYRTDSRSPSAPADGSAKTEKADKPAAKDGGSAAPAKTPAAASSSTSSTTSSGSSTTGSAA